MQLAGVFFSVLPVPPLAFTWEERRFTGDILVPLKCLSVKAALDADVTSLQLDIGAHNRCEGGQYRLLVC